MIRSFIFVIGLLSLSGCANYMVRKDCEAKNWYELGQKIAQSGKRPDADPTVQQCRKVEAEFNEGELDRGFKMGMENYCRPSAVFQTGRNGESFNDDFCNPEHLGKLRAEHRRGINDYCSKEGGYRIGAEGKTYSGVCTKDQEQAFMPEFRRGRKKYLEVMVSEAERQMKENSREVREKERLMSSSSRRLNSLPSPRHVRERRYDMKKKKYVEEERVIDPYQDQRGSLTREISRYQAEINDLTNKRQTLSAQISDHKKELVQVTD